MDYLQGIYPLIYKAQVGEGTFSFVIECPNLAEKARAGPVSYTHLDVYKRQEALRMKEDITSQLGELTLGR